MRAFAAVILWLMLATSSARGDAPDAIVRSTLDPAAGMVVGQRVNLRISVLFPGQMPYPPRVSIPDVPGLQLMLLETQGTTIVDHVGDREYVGKQFEFAAFPRRGGRFTIPPANIALLDASGGTVGSARGAPMSMDVLQPAGIDASAPVMASDKVTASEAWSPTPEAGFKPGGALVRTITREVSDVPALAMRDFAFEAPEGVRVYADPPAADDRTNRGNLTGRRVDKVTYVFEKPGSYELPPLSQPWWDLAGKTARSADLPGTKVVVMPLPSAEKKAGRGAAGRQARALLTAAAVILTLIAVLIASWPGLRRRWLGWRRRQAESEPGTRRRLCRIARTGNAAATYTALKTWLDCLPTEDAEADLASGKELAPLISELEAALFGDRDAVWTQGRGRRLAAVVASIRLRRRTAGAGRRSGLPPLNPAASGSAR